ARVREGRGKGIYFFFSKKHRLARQMGNAGGLKVIFRVFPKNIWISTKKYCQDILICTKRLESLSISY
ncbi:MAG TPA: hypothetical protein PLQ47_09780, partial [Candidatus Marinimicrobia bacterium]|nr:hypothetical protein [Candidatus Neomarinimicrobiota bacterium]